MSYYNIDADKAHRSFKRLKGGQVRILQRHLLRAVDLYMSSRHLNDGSVNVLALRQMSAVYALVALKRELQAEGY